MEKEKHKNTKEDIEFLRKFGLFVLTVVLGTSITCCAICSHNDMVKNGKTFDHNGDIVDDPNLEEDIVVLRKVR